MNSLENKKLSIMEDLLILHYGKGFISDFDTLRDLLEVEFDYVTTTEELEKNSTFEFNSDEEDVELTMRHCGVNY